MDVIKRMYDGLSGRYPEERFDAGDGWIVYLPSAEDGFEVGFEISDDEYLVRFDVWHDHFDHQEVALDWFALGLSDECRLKIVAKGGRPFRWDVEVAADDGAFRSAFTMGILPLKFWRRSITEYRQNHLDFQNSA